MQFYCWPLKLGIPDKSRDHCVKVEQPDCLEEDCQGLHKAGIPCHTKDLFVGLHDAVGPLPRFLGMRELGTPTPSPHLPQHKNYQCCPKPNSMQESMQQSIIS